MARKDREEFRHMHCCGGSGYGKLLFGIFILAIGVSWLGHDMGWWTFTLPWFPLAVVLVGLAILFGWARREYE